MSLASGRSRACAACRADVVAVVAVGGLALSRAKYVALRRIVQ